MKVGENNKSIAVYPGSFDPVTLGHLDIITRAAKQFDKLIVAISNQASKQPLFTMKERKLLLTEVTQEMDNVVIDSFNDLLINYMAKKNASIIVRGLRAVSDFEYELQMASMNRKMSIHVETFFMMTNPKFSFLSSSVVKEIAKFHGPVADFVTPNVMEALRQKYE